MSMPEAIVGSVCVVCLAAVVIFILWRGTRP